MQKLNILIEVPLPFYTWTLANDYEDSALTTLYKKTEFDLRILRLDKPSNFMLIEISWLQCWQTGDLDNSFQKICIEKGIEFLNNIIYHARTFDIATSNIVLVSPRTVQILYFKVLKDGEEILSNEVRLVDDPPKYFREFFENINEPGAYDSFEEIIKTENSAALEINLLVAAYHALYEGRYSESVINSLTAIETHIYPIIKEWVQEQFLNKNSDKIENFLIDMSTPIKYELLFGTIKSDLLEKRPKLLEELKNINKLRNEIIHKAKRAVKNEAYNSLNIASKLILVLYYRFNTVEYE